MKIFSRAGLNFSQLTNVHYLPLDKDAYKVSCSANYMRIELDRRYYNSSKYKSIGMLNPKCGPTLSYDYITLGCIPGACGSIKDETSTKIIYTNAVKLVAKFENRLVSRIYDEEVYFKCSYNRDARLRYMSSFDPTSAISDFTGMRIRKSENLVLISIKGI